MADLVVTSASVAVGATSTVSPKLGLAGEAITAGQVVYLFSSNPNTYKLADANAAGNDAAVGVAVNSAASGQYVAVLETNGVLTAGATVAVGAVYVLSATAGGIAPVADLASGWKTTILGVGISATQIQLKIYASGFAVP